MNIKTLNELIACGEKKLLTKTSIDKLNKQFTIFSLKTKNSLGVNRKVNLKMNICTKPIKRDLEEFHKNKIKDIHVVVDQKDTKLVHAIIIGPKGTPSA
jgi:hypothetical protein